MKVTFKHTSTVYAFIDDKGKEYHVALRVGPKGDTSWDVVHITEKAEVEYAEGANKKAIVEFVKKEVNYRGA